MIREVLFALSVGAFLYALPWIVKTEAWVNTCGAGILTPIGGYFLQWGESCSE